MMKKRIIFFLESITGTYSSYLNLFQERDFETAVFILEKKLSLIEKIKYVKKIISELRRFEPDFIYINDEFFTKVTLLITFCKKFFSKKSKIIVFIASQYIPENTFLNKIKLKFLLGNIDFLICRNKKEFEKIKKINLFKKYPNLYQIYWGFPKELFYKKSFPKKSDKFILGFVGRIIPEKGLDIILECLKKLPDNFILFYAGKVYDHNYNSQINNFIKENNLNERVKYLGFTDYEKLNNIYNLIDLLIIPTTSKPNSFIELFGSILAESMLAKTFVIGSDNGSIPEIIDRNELIFKQSDPEDLLRVINYAYNLSKEKKEEIIEENYQKAIREFSSQAYVENIINTISKNNKILFLNLDFGNKISVKDTMAGLGEIYANAKFKMPITDFIISATIFYNKGLDVTVIDNELDKIDHKKLINIVNQYDKVFLRTSLPTLKSDLTFVGKVKTDVCLFAPFLDKVSLDGYQFISGESEFKFLNIVNKIEYDNNMNLLPSPKWDLVDYKKYSFITCLTSKGCPYNCGYCPYPVYHGTRWRAKNVDLIIKELKRDYFDYGINYLRFRDPEFTINRERAIELCDKIIENRIKIKWHSETRLDLLDKKLLDKMKEAGCVEISFGVETINDETRKIINRKKIEEEKVDEVLNYCKELGIKTFGFFIIGLPGENKKTTLDLIDYSLKINSYLNEFTIATPYPGTTLRSWAQKRNLIIRDFDNYTGRKPAMTNGLMSVRQLKTLCKYANLIHQRKLREQYNINLKRWIYYKLKDLEYYYLKLKVKIIW